MKAKPRVILSALAICAGLTAASLFSFGGMGVASRGAVNALACLIAGVAASFGCLAYYPAAKTPSVQFQRHLFAVVAGLAVYVVSTWGLWAIGVPIENGTVRRGLMSKHYWLGPAVLAYAVVCWVLYRAADAKEGP